MSNNLNFEAAQLPAAQTTRAAVADALWGSLLDKRERKVKTLTLVAVLGAKRKSGKLFTARKRYRLDTRGMKALHADLNQFVGDSTDIDFESLDPETVFIGKSCIVNVVHSYEDGKTVAAFTTLEPDPENTVTVPETFVRDKDRKNNIKLLEIQTPKVEPVQTVEAPEPATV